MKENKTHKILSTILYISYILISFFGFMCGMATDGLIDETNKVIIDLTNIFAYLGLFMPVICFICYLVSKKTIENKSIGIIIRFLPILIFVLMIILDFIVMYIR